VVQTHGGCGTTDKENQNLSKESLGSEEEFHSDPEGTTDDKAAEALALSTYPFYEGHQYPPHSPSAPPGEVVLPPKLSTASSMSQPPEGGAVAPVPKEKGRRPEPFTKQSEYETFRRQLALFFRINREVYPTDLEKIYFTLMLMTDGAPGQWAQNFLEKMDAQAVNGDIPDATWGTFKGLVEALKASFADLNKGKTTYNALETLRYTPGHRADEFFQEFEMLAGCAGYMGATPNNAYLIDLIE